MKLIGTGASHGGNDAAGGTAVLGFIAFRQHRELAHGLDAGVSKAGVTGSPVGVVIDVGAIEQERVGVAAPSGGGKPLPGAKFKAGAGGRRIRCHAGLEKDESGIVAVAARQLSNAPAVHQRGLHRVGRVHWRGIAGAFHGLAAVTPGKLEVHHRFPRHGQYDPGARHSLKSGLAGRDAVVARTQGEHRVAPGQIRHSGPHHAGLFVDRAHRRPHDNRPLLVLDRSPDAARGPLRIALRSADEKAHCRKNAEFPHHETLLFNGESPRRSNLARFAERVVYTSGGCRKSTNAA